MTAVPEVKDTVAEKSPGALAGVANTEAGWMASAEKRVIAYISEMIELELMYKLFDQIVGNLDDPVESLS